MDETWVPDVCTLPSADVPARAAELDELVAASVRDASRLDAGRLRLELDPGPDVAGKAARFAARETACCSFFTFTLTVDDAGLRLDVAVPPERASVLDALMS